MRARAYIHTHRKEYSSKRAQLLVGTARIAITRPLSRKSVALLFNGVDLYMAQISRQLIVSRPFQNVRPCSLRFSKSVQTAIYLCHCPADCVHFEHVVAIYGGCHFLSLESHEHSAPKRSPSDTFKSRSFNAKRRLQLVARLRPRLG